MSGFEKPATAEDVRACYRIFLEREPENAEAVDGQLAGNPTLRELVERFKDCGEALRRQLDRGAALMLGSMTPKAWRLIFLLRKLRKC